LVAGEPRRAIGTVSMDSFAVELDRELPVGTPVVLVGDRVLVEAHARVADTINYEVVCGIDADPRRARRTVVDG
jgi:alanine racemase